MYLFHCPVSVQGGPKSKPLPKEQKIVLKPIRQIKV